MMQAQKFLELINHPEKLDKSTLEPLRELARRYPYSQPIRFLLARNLQVLKHPDFEPHVNRAAASAFNRRHFQSFISGRTNPIDAPAPAAAPPMASSPRPEGLSSRILRWFSKKDKTHAEPLAPLPENPAINPAPEPFPSEFPATPRMPEPEAQPQRKHDELIDRFLKEQPRIRARRDTSSEDNLAEKNLVNPEDLGTETLAEIFRKQGLHERALDIYQKLSLKFPEKSSYFAEKINTIKNEINLKK